MTEAIESPGRMATVASTTDLYDRIEQVLDFAIRNVQQIDLSLTDWNEEIGPHVCFADKVVIETSLLALLVKRTTGNRFKEQLKTLAEALCPFVRNEKNSILLLRLPHSATVFGIGHVALNALGFPDEHFDNLIKSAFQSGEVFNTERLPYRKMDVQWLHNLIFPAAPISMEDTLRHTMLMGTAHPVYMLVPDIYALTHCLMYITDFGTTAVPRCVNADYISSIINSACAHHLLSDNLDILGELIMSGTLMQNEHSPHIELGLILLTGMWDKLGFLPCPTFEAGTYNSLPKEARSSYAFRHLYHTTYVGGIMCCLLVNSEHAAKHAYRNFSPEKCGININNLLSHVTACIKPGTHDDPAIAGADAGFDFITNCLRQRFKGRGSANFMLSLLDTTPSFKNEAVLSVLTDAFLIEAIQNYDLPFLVQVLNFVADDSVPLSLTICKSIEFLANHRFLPGQMDWNAAGAVPCFIKLGRYLSS